MKKRTYAIHISEELDRQLREAFEDGFQACRCMNVFIRHLVTVGLEAVVTERKIKRTRAEARLAAAGRYLPSTEPKPEIGVSQYTTCRGFFEHVFVRGGRV